MREYVVKRLLLTIPVLLLVSIMVFGILRFLPGDAAMLMAIGGEGAKANPELAAALRHKFGLDKPFYIQYLDWIWGIVRYGDLGTSYYTEKPVVLEIVARFPVTVELAIGTAIVSLLIAIPAGVVSAIRQDTSLDYVARVVAVFGLSLPGFWVGTLLIVLPAIWFRYIYPLGYVSIFKDPGANFQQFVFPCLAMGAHYAAVTMRMTRSQMLEVLPQDYIRTAWAKGLRQRAVIFRHALKNAMIPVITIVGMQMGILLGHTVIIETVFGLPGLGTSTIQSIHLRDYAQVQGNILFIATMVVLINLTVDLTYAWLDPRIRYR